MTTNVTEDTSNAQPGALSESFPNQPLRGRSQRAVFLGLVITFLLLPLALQFLSTSVPREQYAYSGLSMRAGPYKLVRDEAFSKSEPIDLLLLGSSLMWNALETPLLKAELDRAAGRNTVVLSLCSNWRGEDLLYAILKDILAHRKVGAVVLSMPKGKERQNAPHSTAQFWLDTRYHAETISQLDFPQRLAIYGVSVLQAPRRIYSLLHPDRMNDHGNNVIPSLGWSGMHRGYYGAPYVPYRFKLPQIAAEDVAYGERTRASFLFTEDPLSHFQDVFTRGIDSLLKAHNVPAIIVNIPISPDVGDSVVRERLDWTKYFTTSTHLLGIPPAKLFSTIPAHEQHLLFYDDHMNVNGARLYTRSIAPAIIQTYLGLQ